MKYTSTVMMNSGEDIGVEGVKPTFESRVEMVHQLFPHLSALEKFVLFTVLDEKHIEKLGTENDCPSYFSLPHIDEGVHQYIGYLTQKEKWEQRKLAEKKLRKIRDVSWYSDRMLVQG